MPSELLRMRLSIGLMIIAAAALLTPARASVLGNGRLVVEVSSGGSPLPLATVEVSGETMTADPQGLLTVSLPAGEHVVSVRSEGFLEFATTVFIEADTEVRLQVELVKAPEIEDEIYVRAARTDRRLEDQPVRVEVVDREEIEEKALMTPGSVGMLLSETTGLRLQTTAPSTGAANVRIQGLRGRYSQMLSDGLPLYGLQGNSLSLLQVPPLDLGQVEIIKGAASALYGPSALGGVIDLISQEPRQSHRELLLNASTQQAGDLTFWMMEPPSENWAYTLIGGIHGQHRQDVDEDGWADMPTYFRGLIRPRFFWTGEKGKSFFSTLGVMAENRSGGTLPGSTTPGGDPFRQTLDTRRIDGGLITRIPMEGSKIFTLRSSLSYQGEDRSFGEARDRGSRTTWFGEAVLQGASGRHVWVIGGALQQELYRNQDYADFDYNFVTPSLIAQDEIALTDRLMLGLSGRVDSHSEYGAFASPRVSLLVKPADAWTVRFSGGTGFFAPTPFVEEIEEVGLSRLQPLQGLVAERARGLSIDTSWARGPVELVATVFGSVVKHPVEREFVGEESVALVNSLEPVHTWGTELLAKFRRGDFLVLATHNFTSSTEGAPGGKGRRSVPLTPGHSASFNAIWENESWGRIGFEAYYTGRQPLEFNPYRSTGRSYLLVGLLAEKRFGRFRLFLNLENLGDVRQTRWDPLLRPEPLPDGRWTVDAWAPLDGRVINGGIRTFF